MGLLAISGWRLHSLMMAIAGRAGGLVRWFRLMQQTKARSQEGASATLADAEARGRPQARVALLSSFTLRGVEEALRAACAREGIGLVFYAGGYQQYAQEILSPEGALYRFRPALVFLVLDARSLLGDLWWWGQPTKLRGWVAEQRGKLAGLLTQLTTRSAAKIVVHTVVVPEASAFGLYEPKLSLGLVEAVQAFNGELRSMSRQNEQLWLFDFDAFCARIGKERAFDERLYYIGDIQLHPRYVPELAKGYMAYVRALVGRVRKCLVVDLDNTLWGGVLGEEGMGGIQLGPTPEGRPYWELQKYLLALWRRGVVLAVNSRNNEAHVRDVFVRHPYMVIKEENIAAWQINWEDKVTNMRRLAEELDLGLDSFVFLDDDPVNRSLVASALPEVAVVELPPDPARYVRAVAARRDFDGFQLTEEDRRRGEMYASQQQRRELKSETLDLTEYWRRLEMVVSVGPASRLVTARVAQLTQKTNQFTVTSRRYQEEEIRRFVHDRYLVACVAVRDVFGDSGLTGVAIVERGDVWRIDSFLLSCRVIGRRVEDVLLAYLVEQARAAGVGELVGEFIPSSRNEPARGFYERCGFTSSGVRDGVEQWVFTVAAGFAYPDFIRVEKSLKPL